MFYYLSDAYGHSARLIWAQEESQNMGAWSYIAPQLEEIFGRKPTYAGRGASASPAVGNLALHRLELTAFLKTVADPETFVDIAAFSLCENPVLKQTLLETLDVHRRFQLFNRELRHDIEQIKLRRKLQGGLPDERIADN